MVGLVGFWRKKSRKLRGLQIETAVRRFVFFLLAGLIITSSLFIVSKYELWESASNIGQQITGVPLQTLCIYKTIGGYEFTIIVKGMCPYVVQVNLVSGQVKK